MNYSKSRKELELFNKKELPKMVEKMRETVFSQLDDYAQKNPGLSSYKLRAAQYNCITENFKPVIHKEFPFFYEMGVLYAYGDGCYDRGGIQACGWLAIHNNHIFVDADPHKYELFNKNIDNKLYLCCGPYVDYEHFGVAYEKIFEKGLKGVYEEAQEALSKCVNEEERDFVETAMVGLLAVKKVAEKFSKAAEEELKTTTDPQERKNLEMIKDTAARVPWNKPETFYEGLCTMSFMKRVLGSLEGVGFHSMGRPDVLLKDLYEKDRAAGKTKEELYDLVCKYMLTWDAYMDTEEIMDGYANYEYECSVTVGGCDSNGDEVFNDVTRLFVQAHEDLTAVYPKIHCRYSSKSSEEYLTLIGSSILNGKSTLLFNNDDSAISALVRSGVELEDARDYIIGGCWDCLIPKLGKRAAGEYFNILKVLELTVNMPQDQLEDNELEFESIENAQSFEEVYSIFMRNVKYLADRKAQMESWGARFWPKVSPLCLNSSLIRQCLDVRKDLTANGQVMNWEGMDFSGTPDVIDSLLAIKKLVYDEKRCSLQDIIYQCKNNWPNEALRQAAINAPSYGDGSDEAAEFSGRLNNDLYEITMALPTAYGEGHYHMGHFMYTEIIWWGKAIKATPNGRLDGDYMSHGLTPSRLHEIKSVTDVFVGLRNLDFSTLSSTSIMNIILPVANMTAEILNDFLRACARAGIQALQVNCVSKEQLLEAQKNPEQHKDIIVRVCGFSAPFVMLSPDFQEEFLSRNYYEM